ncbi:hypothetical protein MJO29_016577 [Puccinia striiformis f. sp. tritici]|nr:hypothetical protein MJO29_016577 [Puccinia striiformis f. sp. tritici]
MIKDKSLVVTLDNRGRLPTFEILKKAVEEVMSGQIALTFEDSRSKAPVASPFLAANDVMKKMGKDRRPKQVTISEPKPEFSMDELTKMFQTLQQFLQRENPKSSSERPSIICFYCHRENHGTNRCYELQKDVREGLVRQEGGSFYLPNGALIPFDRSRPIRHVVASYVPGKAPTPSTSPTAPRPSTSFATGEFKSTCGLLEPWFPPVVSSQSFAGSYEADPAGRKRHEEPKPFKAPIVPPSRPQRSPRKNPAPSVDPEDQRMEDEPALFERKPVEPVLPDVAEKEPEVTKLPTKKVPSLPKARFERDATRDHPNAVEVMLKKISDLHVPDVTVSELMALAPAVAEGVKKWVSRKRVEIGQDEMKVQSGTLMEGSEFQGKDDDPKLYSCPLGYLSCLIGDEGSPASPLVDSGSQLNLISDSLATQFKLTPRVNFSSAVYGINNQACELLGVAEDVQIRIGKNIIGSCHFWITRMDGPFILGRPFLIDFDATLSFSSQSGEKIILPDTSGRDIEVSLCPTDTGRWERNFPSHGRKGVLSRMARLEEEEPDIRHFL